MEPRRRAPVVTWSGAAAWPGWSEVEAELAMFSDTTRSRVDWACIPDEATLREADRESIYHPFATDRNMRWKAFTMAVFSSYSLRSSVWLSSSVSSTTGLDVS